MKTILVIIFLTELQIINCFAQPQFQLTIGGTNLDEATSIIQSTDGGYVIAGYSQSFGAGNSDMYVLKISPYGTLQWSKAFGGTLEEKFSSIINTADSGYILVGDSYSFGVGNNDMYLVKLSSDGSIQWAKTLGGAFKDAATSVIQTADGGYAVAGWTTSFGAGGLDMLIAKIDVNGSLVWAKTAGGTNIDVAFSIVQTSDGGYAVAGETYSFGLGIQSMYVVKLDGNGSLQWSKTVGGTHTGSAYSIIQSTDGGYVVAGWISAVSTPDDDMLIVKLDANGSLLWTRTFGGILNDYANCIIRTPDGGYVAVGNTGSFGAGGFDMYIVKLDANGLLLWSKTVGGINDDVASSVARTTDGGFIVGGWTESFGSGNRDMYILKLDQNGNICGNSTNPTSNSGTSGTLTSPATNITIQNPTVTAPTPSVFSGGALNTICIVGITPISSGIPKSFSLHQNYPNPFNPSTVIYFDLSKRSFVKLVVYDGLGKEVQTLVNDELLAGSYSVDWNASRFPSGVYFCRLTADDYEQIKKMVLIK